MISIFHLLWIVPHAGSIGFMAAAMLRFLMEKFLYNEVTDEQLKGRSKNQTTLGIYGVTNIADISQGNFWNSNGTQIYSVPDRWGGKTQSQIKEAYPDLVVQFCLQLVTPTTFQATGNQPLPAVAGLNTVYTDGDSLAVSGRQDLLYTLQTMQTQTQNLNRFIAEGGTR